MKMAVIWAVLVASLLLMTGAAFAVSCTSCPGELVCYKVTGTDLTTPANSFTKDWSICFVSYVAAYVCDRDSVTFLFGLSLFPEGLTTQAISFDSGAVGAYMKFHGSGDFGDIFNGFYFNQPDRFLIHGVLEEEGCPPII